MEENRESLVYSVDEARKLLGISRGLMYEAIRTGQIPSIHFGRRILIPRASLKRLLEEAAKSQGNSSEDLP
jgi:excisionase family DNA binding protein